MTTAPPDDLLAPEAVRDPQAFFWRLREHDPVFWSRRHKVFILTAHADVERVFQDRTMSTARGIGGFRARLQARHAVICDLLGVDVGEHQWSPTIVDRSLLALPVRLD